MKYYFVLQVLDAVKSQKVANKVLRKSRLQKCILYNPFSVVHKTRNVKIIIIIMIPIITKFLLNKLNYIGRDTNQWTSGTIRPKKEPCV